MSFKGDQAEKEVGVSQKDHKEIKLYTALVQKRTDGTPLWSMHQSNGRLVLASVNNH